MQPIIYLDYPLEKQLLIDHAASVEDKGTYGQHKDHPDWNNDYWKDYKFESNVTDKLIKDFELQDARPRYYWLPANITLEQHTDDETTCSLNFALSDRYAPVTIGDNNYMYKQCLLNTTVPHGVVNGNRKRVLLKISIFGESYESLAKRIKYAAATGN